MDRVGAADHHRPGVLARLAREQRDQRVCLGQQQVGGRAALQRQRRVDHVARGQAEVDVAALGADRLGDLADEGDHVVVGRPLELGDARHVDRAPDPRCTWTDGTGTWPRRASACSAAISTRSMCSKRASSVHSAPISGSV